MSTRLGLVRCEFCQRQFNPHSAARHIPWCKKQLGESKRHRLSAEKLEALERYRWRISYKPSNCNQLSGARGSAPAPSQHGSSGSNNNRSYHHFGHSQQGQLLQKLAARNEPQQQQQQQQQRRQRSSINSSATLSSPSAGSLSSLSTSIASANGRAAHNHSGNNTQQASHVHSTPPPPPPGKLKRSVSSVTLTKRHGGVALTIAAGKRTGGGGGCESRNSSAAARNQSNGGGPARTKSVSDLSDMSELVGVLAKRMEEIYAQNKLLLGALMSGHCDNGARREEDAELELCHHCRTRCSLGANYCHKCGCKMRPSNPTPPPPTDLDDEDGAASYGRD